jgi:hypothetical protein
MQDKGAIEIPPLWITNINVGSEVFTAVAMKSIIFWDITPCSPLGVNRRFGGTYRLHIQHLLACWFLAELISSPLKMEAICLSETSVETQRTTRRYIPEDGYSSINIKIITGSSIRPTEVSSGDYETEPFHCFRGRPKLPLLLFIF